MGRKRKGARILPARYDERRKRWHVAAFDARGERSDAYCEDESEVEQINETLRKELGLEGPITVGKALEEYEAWQVARGKKGGSIATTQTRLSALCGADGGRLCGVRAAEAYAAFAARTSVDTHRNALGEARTFGAWCVRRQHLARNPWKDVEPVGKRRKGKAKLRVDEARALMATCMRLDDEAAVAAMCGLLLGFGASEIVERVGRDVDDGGAILWMDHGKTENRERNVEVPLLPEPLEPEWLRRKLAELAAEAGPAGYLWRAGSRSKKAHRDRNWVLDNVKRICRLAGVPEVTSHGLRGTNATIARSQGATSAMVAAALGNTEAVAKAHYIGPGAAETGRSKRALQVLAGGKR